MSAWNVADRLDILNTINLYSYYFDEGYAQEWTGLFTEGGTFIVQQLHPEKVENTIAGSAALHGLASRMAETRDERGRERHLLTNISVLAQTSEGAEVTVGLLLVRTDPSGRTTFETPGRYTGTLVKQAVGWKIDRWHVTLDADRTANLR
jgi:hypothetical protein